ncbi:MAG: hypothetical protein IKJ80_04670 [Clostridia bacterium]|nr:hypothetical protein [Clostridia bacterium]
MKKKLYYAIPFIVIPALLLLLELFDNSGIIEMSPYVMAAFLMVACAVFGFFSSSEHFSDYLLTLILPLSLFCFTFIGGFLDENDIGARFSLDRAVQVSFQPFFSLMYACMAAVTFLTSIKAFRNLKKRN